MNVIQACTSYFSTSHCANPSKQLHCLFEIFIKLLSCFSALEWKSRLCSLQWGKSYALSFFGTGPTRLLTSIWIIKKWLKWKCGIFSQNKFPSFWLALANCTNLMTRWKAARIFILALFCKYSSQFMKNTVSCICNVT